MPSKYGNVRAEARDGQMFASRKEQRRYDDLVLIQKSGEISGLKTQVRYPLVVNKVKIGAYVADFVFSEDGKLVVEDAKGYKTPVYKIKKLLMLALYGIEIKET